MDSTANSTGCSCNCSSTRNRFSVQWTDSSNEDTKNKLTCESIVAIVVMYFLGLTLLIYANIELIPHRPNIYIQEFLVPALKHPTHFNATSLNTTIFMDLEFQKYGKRRFDTSYADLEMMVFYGADQSFPVGYYMIPAFVMGDAVIHH